MALIAGVPDAAARRQWTYAELYAQSLRTARALSQRFKPGERVAVWAPNLPEWVMMEFGCALAGVVLVTVNPAFRAHEVEYVLRQSRSAGVFVVDSFRGNPMRATVDALAANLPELRHVVGFEAWDQFVATGDAPGIVLPQVLPADPVMIQYTSGTTGFPKGALLHHRGLANNGAHTAHQMGVADGAVWVTTMPLFHTGGCVCCVLGAVSKRCTQVLVEAFEPGLVLELFNTYRGNAMIGVPTMLVAMMEHPAFASTDLSSTQSICSGGSLVPEALVRRFEQQLGAPFTIVFGQTECSPVASMTRPDDSVRRQGRHHRPADAARRGEDHRPGQRRHAAGRPGRRVLHPRLPRDARLLREPRGHRCGHRRRRLAAHRRPVRDGRRGYCTVEGRLKDMIIRGGENIYPRELEELLFKHPSVGEVAVVGLPDAKWGEVVAAFLRPKPGQHIDKGALTDYMREHLAPHKTPRHWFQLDAFPLTGSGKIQKFKLRDSWQRGEFNEL